jgi:hypothetical protein
MWCLRKTAVRPTIVLKVNTILQDGLVRRKAGSVSGMVLYSAAFCVFLSVGYFLKTRFHRITYGQ